MGLRSEALHAYQEVQKIADRRRDRRRTEIVNDAKLLFAKRLGNDYDPKVKEVDLSRSLVTLEVEGIIFLVGRWDVYLGSFSRRLAGLADLGAYLDHKETDASVDQRLIAL